MKIQTKEIYTLDGYFSQLRTSFSSTTGSLVVVGSLVRGEQPVSDIDLKIFGNTMDLKNPELPKECLGKPVNFKFAPTANIEHTFTHSLRHYPILLDGEIIRGEEPFVRIFETCKEKIQEKGFLEYMLFLLEEEAIRKNFLAIYGFNFNDYFCLKRMNGSRRTIDSIAKVYRLISAHCFECKETMKVLEQAKDDRWLPEEILESVRCVYLFLESMDPTLRAVFLQATKKIYNFFETEVRECIYHNYIHRGSREYLQLIKDAKTKFKAEDIWKEIATMPTSSSKWLLLFVLAANKLISGRVLSEIYEATIKKEEYRHITRVLLRNPSFSTSTVQFSHIASDETSVHLYKDRNF